MNFVTTETIVPCALQFLTPTPPFQATNDTNDLLSVPID